MELGTLEAAAELGSATLFLDVREQWEFDEGHVPGAVNIPLGELAARAGGPHAPGGSSLEDRDRRIVCCCAVGVRSGFAVRILRELGFADAVNLSAGMVDWVARGLPVEP